MFWSVCLELITWLYSFKFIYIVSNAKNHENFHRIWNSCMVRRLSIIWNISLIYFTLTRNVAFDFVSWYIFQIRKRNFNTNSINWHWNGFESVGIRHFWWFHVIHLKYFKLNNFQSNEMIRFKLKFIFTICVYVRWVCMSA